MFVASSLRYQTLIAPTIPGPHIILRLTIPGPHMILRLSSLAPYVILARQVQGATLLPHALAAAWARGVHVASVCCVASIVDSRGVPLAGVEERSTSTVAW